MLDEVSVVDGQCGHPADGFGGGDLVLAEDALATRLQQLHGADHLVLGDQGHDEFALVAVGAHGLPVPGAEAPVVEAGHGDRPPAADGRSHYPELIAPEVAPGPRFVPVLVTDTGRTHEPVTHQRVDAARGHVGDGAQVAGRRGEHLLQVEDGRELHAEAVDEREALGALVDLLIERGIDQCAGGDLRQALQQVDAFELTRPAIEDADHAHDLAAVDERQAQAAAEVPAQPLAALELGEALVGGAVVARHRRA